MHRLGVPVEHRHAHCGRIDQDGVVFHDFLGFPHHFHFLLGVAVFHEHVDLRQHGERDAFRVYLDFDILLIEQRAGLRGQFINRFLAGAGHGLVCRDVDARDAHRILDRLQSNQHLDGRAVWVGDDATVLVLRDGMRVHFRHHQWNIFVITEMRGVIDHHATGCRGERRIFFRHAAARREQADLRLGKVKPLHVNNSDFLAVKCHRRTCRTAGGQRIKIAHRKLALLQNSQHRLAHRASRAQYAYIVPVPGQKFFVLLVHLILSRT